MITDRLEQLVHFSIIQPRWHDRRVLLSKLKVDQPYNKKPIEGLKITFTSKYMTGDWYITRSKVRRYKVESNGVIDVYSVPLDKLEPLERSERSIYE